MTVRTIEPDEVAGYLGCMRTACLTGDGLADDQAAWAAERWQLDRTWSAFDGGTLCGTSRSFPTRLTVPGGPAPSTRRTGCS